MFLSRTTAFVFLVMAINLLGCANLPVFIPDLSRNSSPLLKISGDRGIVSQEKSRRIINKLRPRNSETNIFDSHLELEQRISGSPLSMGNYVQLLQDGPATYREMLAAIAQAKDHINMETYIMDDDEVGRLFAEALINKQLQGVQVNLIYDSAGTFTTPRSYFKRMIETGVSTVEYNPINPLISRKIWQLNQRDHRKLLIVDGNTVFLGGINISSVYSGGSNLKGLNQRNDVPLAWRDTDLKIRGPIVAEFQRMFLSTWDKQKGPQLAEKLYFPPLEAVGPHLVRAIGSTPDESFSQIYVTLLSAISNAETSIYLTNAYFAPDPQLLAVLELAAKRGVDVKLILPNKTDSWLVFHAGRSYYTRLLRSGVKIYERRGVILHSKTALIDGVWSTIGSTNLDWRSFLHNQEVNAVVLGEDFGRQVQRMFDLDLAGSDPVLLESWEKRGLNLHFKELMGQLWEYWL